MASARFATLRFVAATELAVVSFGRVQDRQKVTNAIANRLDSVPVRSKQAADAMSVFPVVNLCHTLNAPSTLSMLSKSWGGKSKPDHC